MNKVVEQKDLRDQIVFIGQTLGPFYLEDPANKTIAVAFEAIKDLEVEAASSEWPFVATADAADALSLMQEGLANGIDSDDLVWEYRRLFVGPAIKPAPPWGSVYTDKDGVVFGQSTLELRSWMRQQGIERLADEKTPEDHIGLMLLLMAWLAQNKPEFLEEFLGVHFFTWSSHFLKKLAKSADQAFYRGLTQITQKSLEGIQAELSIPVDYPRFYR